MFLHPVKKMLELDKRESHKALFGLCHVSTEINERAPVYISIFEVNQPFRICLECIGPLLQQVDNIRG